MMMLMFHIDKIPPAHIANICSQIPMYYCFEQSEI